MNILLLDDDKEVADSITGALEDRGHTVWWAGDLATAHAMLDFAGPPEGFNLAILDLNLQGGEKGPALLPLDFPACVYSGLPNDAEMELSQRGIDGVRVFSKGDPFALIDYIEEVAS